MTDHFTGGQHCEETGTHRSTSVHFICCQKRPDSETTILVNGQPPRHGLSSATTQSGQLAVIYIDRVEETQVCQYDIDICVPKLCRAPPVESTSVVKTPSVTGTPTVTGALEVADEDDDQTLVNVVQSLAKNCLYRQEDWWMYEICFKTGIRQMHARSEGMQQSNGIIQHLQVIDDQYSLGEAPVDIYSDKSALMHAAGIRVSSDVDDGSMPDPLQPKETSDKSNASYRKNDIYKGGKLQIPTSGMPVTGFAKDDSPKFLSLEFKNGTACDIESLNRSTTVQIHCGMREVIMDILEDRTCHYTIKVSTPLLCLHAAFAPAKQALERFVLIPENSKSYIDAMEKKLGGSSERDSIWTNSDNYYDNQSIGGNPSNTLLSDEDHFIGTNEEDSDEYDDGSESESVSSSTNEEL